MRMRITAVLLVSLGFGASADAGLFGSNRKKLPKPIALVHIRAHGGKRFANPTRISSRYGPEWGRAVQIIYQPQQLRASHYTAY